MSGLGVNVRVSAYSQPGLRKYMTDRFSISYNKDYVSIGLFDGHGDGPEAVHFAHEHLLNFIVNQRGFKSDSDQDILKAIHDGFIATHFAMRKASEKWPRESRGYLMAPGTTATVAFIMRGKLYIGYVGDITVVLGYKHEHFQFWHQFQLTREHKASNLIESQRVLQAGGAIVDDRVVWRHVVNGPFAEEAIVRNIPYLPITRSLGDFWSYNPQTRRFVISPEPDLTVLPLNPRKHGCVILGTDGLWDMLERGYAVYAVHSLEERNIDFFINNPINPNPDPDIVDESI